MNRPEQKTELYRLVNELPDIWLGVALYILRRLASGERLGRSRDGIGTATDSAAHACDIAVDRIAEFLEHGPTAVVSPARISAPKR